MAVPPSEILVEPMVTLEFASRLFGMLVLIAEDGMLIVLRLIPVI